MLYYAVLVRQDSLVSSRSVQDPGSQGARVQNPFAEVLSLAAEGLFFGQKKRNGRKGSKWMGWFRIDRSTIGMHVGTQIRAGVSMKNWCVETAGTERRLKADHGGFVRKGAAYHKLPKELHETT